jgi:hypothetical protein
MDSLRPPRFVKKSNTLLSSFSPEAISFFVAGVRERATETKKVIFQRVAEFISATRFLQSRRSGDIFLTFIVEKAQRSGFFDSLRPPAARYTFSAIHFKFIKAVPDADI